ncbi:transposase, partial [Xanthomonas citri]
MKKSRFTDSQIIAVLKQAQAGETWTERCLEPGLSPAAGCQWG